MHSAHCGPGTVQGANCDPPPATSELQVPSPESRLAMMQMHSDRDAPPTTTTSKRSCDWPFPPSPDLIAPSQRNFISSILVYDTMLPSRVPPCSIPSRYHVCTQQASPPVPEGTSVLSSPLSVAHHTSASGCRSFTFVCFTL